MERTAVQEMDIMARAFAEYTGHTYTGIGYNHSYTRSGMWFLERADTEQPLYMLSEYSESGGIERPLTHTPLTAQSMADALYFARLAVMRERMEARERAQAPTIIGTLRLLDVRFTIEDDDDGDTVQVWSDTADDGCSPEPRTDETIECEDIGDAVSALQRHGATEWQGRWWADPDGSQITDYATGERAEYSAHPSGFSDDDIALIILALSHL